ncbi:MAG: nuclear transport factor 2 family protein [Bryobacteraceae bacterium]|nr:nuclear transport factor 2 family protein [Bryobacteraceae bacterium]
MKVILLFAVAGALALAASDAEVQKAEKDWAAAVMAQDQRALGQILSDDLIYAHSTGVIEDKAKYLSNLKTGAAKYDRIEHQSVTARTYGDAAVAHSMVRMTGSNKDGPFDNRLMMMHVWVKQGGRWRLAAHQTTRLP